MKKWLILLLLCLLFACDARAAELPQETELALPREARMLMRGVDMSEEDVLGNGMAAITEAVAEQTRGLLRERLKGTILLLVVVLFCTLMQDTRQAAGTEGWDLTTLAGALSIAAVSAGSVDSVAALGLDTMDAMGVFSKTLLPTLAAAVAAAGAIQTATVQQMMTVLLSDLLMQLIRELLLPLVYLYIGVLTASTMLSDGRLHTLAEGLKKAISWILGATLMAFTLYLSVSRVFCGSVDSNAIRMTKVAISGAIPVVGGILADASEAVLAGAGVLRGTIGVFGMLGVISICAVPFLKLGIQYLLYKGAALLAGVMGAPNLCRLIDGLAGAFGLILGMTGACGVLLLVSILTSVAAVTV